MSFHCLQHAHAIRHELGGVVGAVLALCGNLAERGHRITLLTGDTQDVPEAWLRGEAGCPHVVPIQLPQRSLLGLPRSAMDVIRPLFESADILHLHQLWKTGNHSIARMATSQNLPYVVSSHGMLDEWAFSQRPLTKRLFMKLSGRKFLSNAAAIHCTAEGERRQVERAVPGGRFFVAPHYFDWSLFKELPGPELARQQFPVLDTNKPKVLCLSRLHPVKGADVLLRAIAQVLAQGVEVSLYLAGPDEGGYRAVLERLVQSLGIEPHVHFLGMVRGKEKVSLYEACDLFAMPTMQENFGIVLVEAMGAGSPVITTSQVDIWPELEAAGGQIVDRTPEAFAKAIREMLTRPDELQPLGTRARQAMLSWLDPQSVSDQYEGMYRECIGQHL